MSEWKECKIGDVCDTQTGPFGSQLHNEDYVEIGTPIVTVEHLGSKNFTTQNLPCVSDEDKQRLSKYTLTKGDVVFSRVGSVDRCSYVSDIYNGWLFSGRCLRVRSKNNTLLDSEFLFYHFSNERIKTYIRNIAVGATMPSINTKLLNEVPITIPPLSEQKKIVAVLSALDEKIETNRKINARLEELAQAIFKSWFIDFEPFGDQMPNDWKEDNIYRYVDVIYGAPYKSNLFNAVGNGLPLIRIRDLKTNQPQVFTPEILPNTEYVEAGDIVVGMDAEFEPYFWFGNKGVLNQRVCKFKSKSNKVGSSFILYLTQPKLRFVQSYKVGTTVSHLGKSDIDKFKFFFPPLEIIESYSKIAEPILERRIKVSKESARLAELRDTLLPKLMSGELKPE